MASAALSLPARGAVAWRPAATLACALLATAWVCRFQIASGFGLAFGDRYDAMIEVALLQHWANFLAGLEPWNRTAWFHPTADTLGYNDGYLLYGLLYAPFRAAGLPPVAAAEAVHAACKLAGFVGMARLLERAFRLPWGWSLWGATLFTVAQLTVTHANHGQLFTLALAPWTAHAALSFLRTRDLRAGLAAVALWAGWISTAFYLAWFFALFALLLAGIALATSAEVRAGARALLHDRSTWIVAAAGAALLVPFLLVYLPKVRETGMHDAAYAAASRLWPLELVNTGPGSPWWPVLSHLRLPADHDLAWGLPPLTLALAVTAAFRAGRAGQLLAWTGFATMLSWLLMLDLGGLQPWRLVRAVVPGAGGIRVIGRYQLLLLMPVVVLLATMLATGRRPRLAVALATLLLVEQVTTAAPLNLDGRTEESVLASVPPPPPACASFAVRSARTHPRPVVNAPTDAVYAHNVDAMVLASVWARPTVNGFSTFNPPGWDLAWPDRPDYPARVAAWTRRHGLPRPCLLDMRRPLPWSRELR